MSENTSKLRITTEMGEAALDKAAELMMAAPVIHTIMTYERVAQLRMTRLAASVRSNGHLRDILQDADPRMRAAVYDAIVPHLKFKPKSLHLMRFHDER